MIEPVTPAAGIGKADSREWGFQKWDRDFRFLLDCFESVLKSSGEARLADALSRAFSGETVDEPLPPRGAQAFSIAFHMLGMAEENTSNQVRRLRETANGPAAEVGSWSYYFANLKRDGFTEADVRAALPRVGVQPVLTAHPYGSEARHCAGAPPRTVSHARGAREPALDAHGAGCPARPYRSRGRAPVAHRGDLPGAARRGERNSEHAALFAQRLPGCHPACCYRFRQAWEGTFPGQRRPMPRA